MPEGDIRIIEVHLVKVSEDVNYSCKGCYYKNNYCTGECEDGFIWKED